MEARERAEHLRHALRQEEARVSDLGAKLATTREAHRHEQKRAAGQAEVISKLNRDIDSLKRQLQVRPRFSLSGLCHVESWQYRNRYVYWCSLISVSVILAFSHCTFFVIWFFGTVIISTMYSIDP